MFNNMWDTQVIISFGNASVPWSSWSLTIKPLFTLSILQTLAQSPRWKMLPVDWNVDISPWITPSYRRCPPQGLDRPLLCRSPVRQQSTDNSSTTTSTTRNYMWPPDYYHVEYLHWPALLCQIQINIWLDRATDKGQPPDWSMWRVHWVPSAQLPSRIMRFSGLNPAGKFTNRLLSVCVPWVVFLWLAV